MKNKSLLSLFAATALIATVGGCKKEEPTVQKAADQTKAAGSSALDAMKDVAAAETATKAATDKAQEIIKQARNLVSAGKFQDALTALNNLSGIKLTDAQQKLVDSLKAQIQKALADKTAESAKGAVGNLLGK